jgi:hypothetical protein
MRTAFRLLAFFMPFEHTRRESCANFAASSRRQWISRALLSRGALSPACTTGQNPPPSHAISPCPAPFDMAPWATAFATTSTVFGMAGCRDGGMPAEAARRRPGLLQLAGPRHFEFRGKRDPQIRVPVGNTLTPANAKQRRSARIKLLHAPLPCSSVHSETSGRLASATSSRGALSK